MDVQNSGIAALALVLLLPSQHLFRHITLRDSIPWSHCGTTPELSQDGYSCRVALNGDHSPHFLGHPIEFRGNEGERLSTANLQKR